MFKETTFEELFLLIHGQMETKLGFNTRRVIFEKYNPKTKEEYISDLFLKKGINV